MSYPSVSLVHVHIQSESNKFPQNIVLDGIVFILYLHFK
jgi:hypothetical protein